MRRSPPRGRLYCRTRCNRSKVSKVTEIHEFFRRRRIQEGKSADLLNDMQYSWEAIVAANLTHDDSESGATHLYAVQYQNDVPSEEGAPLSRAVTCETVFLYIDTQK